MEAIIFIGIQAAGKSTAYKRIFADTHIRVNLDMLNTRNKERILIEACIEMEQSFVVDNTNITREKRKRYIDRLKATGCKIIAYYFDIELEEALKRNSKRTGKACIPETAIRTFHRNLELPCWDEGFDEIHHIKLFDSGVFEIREQKRALSKV